MFSFLKNRKTPRTHESPAPSEDRERLPRGMSPRRGKQQDLKDDGGGSRRRVWTRDENERYRGEDADSMQALTPNTIQAQHGIPAYARSGFRTPPTRKPPGTPRHLKDDTGARPATGAKPPRTAPRTGGRRDISSADGPDSVKILVRVRPFNEAEQSLGSHSSVRCRSDRHLSLIPHSEASQYVFDGVLSSGTAQEDVFEAAGKAVVNNCFDGYNACVFAYGQTGSGKTHTMLGDISNGGAITPTSGLVPRIFDDLLTQMASRSAAAAACDDDADDSSGAAEMVAPGTLTYDCHVSMLEIFNESITDLLQPENTNLQIREDAVQGIHVENLSKRHVHAVADVLDLLEHGTKNRHIGETRMNRESSRSHCVLVATLRAERRHGGVRNILTSRLNLVDLAGSEQQKSSGAVGERLREASNINKSLSILGRVINSLAQQHKAPRAAQHIPYRDSKLTFLLQDSLGGNSKTVMIANVSPSTANINETQSTLRFAQRAKRMGNKATVNENTGGDPEAMRREIARLKRDLAEARSGAGSGAFPGITCTPADDGMSTPLLFPGAPSAIPAGTPGAASPHTTAVVELVHAVERAQQAENLVSVYKQKTEALQAQCSAYEQEKLKRKMMEKFRDGEVARLQKIVHSGKVTGAELLVNDTIDKLHAKVALCEAQRDCLKAEVHTAETRNQELRTRLLDARNRRDPDRTALLEQVHNLQNLLLVLKAPGEGAAAFARSDDGLGGDSLFGALDMPPLDNAMSRGAEMLCHQKTRDAELVEAEKAKHEAAIREVREAHSRELSSLRTELTQQQEREREREDDSCRVHDELLAVRSELAQARADSERAYHDQLIPTQKELKKVKEELAGLRGRVADLEEQVSDLTAALTREASAKVNTQEELSRVGEALEVSMASAEDLRRQCEEQALALDDAAGRTDWLDSVQAEMREVNRRNTELETRNADLEWEAARAEEARQSQVLSLSAVPADDGAGGVAPVKTAVQQQAEHVVEVLRTEVQGLTIQLQQAKQAAAEREAAASKQLDSVQAALRAAEIERDDLHLQYLQAMKQTEALLEDKLQLETNLGSAESMLHSERQSVSDMRAELQRAKAPPPDSPGADADERGVRDELESTAAERDSLLHEVTMLRETVKYNRLKSVEARSSRASDVPADSIAGQFHAHTERIRELQGELEELEGERNQAVADLEEERERRAQEAMSLRKEVIAVQQSLADDKERTVTKITTDYERQLGVSEAKLKEVRAAVRHANKAAAQHEAMVARLRKQLAAAEAAPISGGEQLMEVKAEQERCLRDYAQLAGAVMQLAAWTCGAGDSSAGLPALRGSGLSAASDENRDSHNRAPSGGCGGLMSPRSAALALQNGPAGEALGHVGQWTKVSAVLRASGKQASLEELSEGHGQLKTTVSDLLIWLNASNVGM